jgi:predicted nucleic acid-binding protein
MSALVVDASAALALLRGESAAEDVRRHLRDQVNQGGPLLVPTLFWLELVNVLAHRYRVPPEAMAEAVYDLEQLGLTTTEVGRPGSLAVIDVVGSTGLTAYDAAYLVLAEASDACLLTADSALAAAAGERAILAGEIGGVAEAPAAFIHDRSWARWKGAGQYLAELRRAADSFG